MASNNPVTVSGRVNSRAKEEGREIAEKEGRRLSDIVREAFYDYLSDYELENRPKEFKKMLNEKDMYKEAQIKNERTDRLQKYTKSKYHRNNVIDFIDDILEDYYRDNAGRFAESEMSKRMRDLIKHYKDFAIENGFSDKFDKRMQKPIKYAKIQQKRKIADKKAFREWKQAISNYEE